MSGAGSELEGVGRKMKFGSKNREQKASGTGRLLVREGMLEHLTLSLESHGNSSMPRRLTRRTVMSLPLRLCLRCPR
jgi:hypothetical protein